MNSGSTWSAPSGFQSSSSVANTDVRRQGPPSYPGELRIQPVGQSLTLALRGEIDLMSAPAFERELRQAEGSARRIVLDLSELEFIDSAGLHVLIDAQHRAESNGHALAFEHVPAHAQRLFSLTGINPPVSVQ